MLGHMKRRLLRLWWRLSERKRHYAVRLFEVSFALFGVASLLLIRNEWVRPEPDVLKLNWLVLVVVGQLLLTSLYLSRKKNTHWFANWFAGLSHEFAGAFILTALLLILVTTPEQRRNEREYKARILRELRSTDTSIAALALAEAQSIGWLSDGTFRGESLVGANLPNASLTRSDLQQVDLSRANLENSYLGGSNLKSAQLGSANLSEADLRYATLEAANLVFAELDNAILGGVNLQNADLRVANLTEALLYGANLKGAELWAATLDGARFSETTVLPDGTFWNSEVDMQRFTDDTVPDFWRSSDPNSPASVSPGLGQNTKDSLAKQDSCLGNLAILVLQMP